MSNIRYNSFIESDWDRILYNAKVMNFAKNKKFLRKLIYSGRVSTRDLLIPKYDISQVGNFTNTNRFREMYYRRLCDYIDTYQNKFGDDWDVHFEKSYDHMSNINEVSYVISLFKVFDKVVVNNYDKETSHTIRDLAVFNTVGMKTNGDFWIPRMKGLRLTFSKAETRSGYVHSHLNVRGDLRTSNCDFLSEFCIGSGSDTSMLSGSLATEFSKEQFELYLYSQDSIIECESAIGTPYIRFSHLREQSRERISMNTEDVYYSRFTAILFSGTPIDVNYYISDNKYFIKNNNVFHSFIKNLILNNLPSSVWKKYLCKKGEDDNYYSYRSLEETVDNSTVTIAKDSNSNTAPYIYYRGIKKEFKMAKEHIKTDNKLKIEEFIVYPNLLNYIHEQLEHKLQETAVAASNIRRHYSSNNVSSYLR
jgi:hypothetical protein